MGDILVDDKPHLSGHNVEPTWERVFFDQEYNKDLAGARILSGWEDWREAFEEAADV